MLMKISKTRDVQISSSYFWLFLILGIIIVTFRFLSILSFFVISIGGVFGAFILTIVPRLVFLLTAILVLSLYYKMWKAIQDGHARMTPRNAVILLFIPLYNFYWIFQVLWGFAKDYNSFVDRHQIAASKLPENLFMIGILLMFIGPCLNYIVWEFSTGLGYMHIGSLPVFIVHLVLIKKISEATSVLDQSEYFASQGE